MASFDPDLPIEEVKRLRLSADDILVVKLPEAVAAPAVADIRDKLQAILGADQRIVVLSQGVELEVLQGEASKEPTS